MNKYYCNITGKKKEDCNCNHFLGFSLLSENEYEKFIKNREKRIKEESQWRLSKINEYKKEIEELQKYN